MKRIRKMTIAVVGVLGLGVVGCAPPPPEVTANPEDPTPTEAAPVTAMRACMVTEEADEAPGGLAESSLAGLDRAAAELGVQTDRASAAAADEYAAALQTMADSGCDLVIGVGDGAGESVVAAAKANPEVQFALVDASVTEIPANLRPVVFSTHESGFLAGYVAASHTSSGTVGAFGALDVTRVTSYLDGFWQGVTHFNQTMSADVKVVGWDHEARTGTFVRSSTDAWHDAEAGRAAAQSLADQGADVILAVAGDSGVGALQLARDDNAQIVWADTDGCQTQAEYCAQILTSAVKDREAAVYELVRATQEGRASSGVFAANLRNGGVHLTESVASADLQAVTDGLIDGSIQVQSTAVVG